MEYSVTVKFSLDELMAGEDFIHNHILHSAVDDIREHEPRLDDCAIRPLVVNEMKPITVDAEGNVVIEATVTVFLED